MSTTMTTPRGRGWEPGTAGRPRAGTESCPDTRGYHKLRRAKRGRAVWRIATLRRADDARHAHASRRPDNGAQK